MSEVEKITKVLRRHLEDSLVGDTDILIEEVHRLIAKRIKNVGRVKSVHTIESTYDEKTGMLSVTATIEPFPYQYEATEEKPWKY